MKLRHALFLSSVLCLAAFAQDAAQPAAAPAAAPESDSRSSIEEIQITARKTTENLQDSPIAVSAFGADSIENLGISDTQDVSSLAPNLYLTQTPGSSANLALSIRGVAGAEPLAELAERPVGHAGHRRDEQAVGQLVGTEAHGGAGEQGGMC